MRLVFDRGTLLIEDPPADLDPAALAAISEIRWDDRVGKHRAGGGRDRRGRQTPADVDTGWIRDSGSRLLHEST